MILAIMYAAAPLFLLLSRTERRFFWPSFLDRGLDVTLALVVAPAIVLFVEWIRRRKERLAFPKAILITMLFAVWCFATVFMADGYATQEDKYCVGENYPEDSPWVMNDACTEMACTGRTACPVNTRKLFNFSKS